MHNELAPRIQNTNTQTSKLRLITCDGAKDGQQRICRQSQESAKAPALHLIMHVLVFRPSRSVFSEIFQKKTQLRCVAMSCERIAIIANAKKTFQMNSYAMNVPVGAH